MVIYYAVVDTNTNTNARNLLREEIFLFFTRCLEITMDEKWAGGAGGSKVFPQVFAVKHKRAKNKV